VAVAGGESPYSPSIKRPISEERWGRITAIRMPDGNELRLYQPKHSTPRRGAQSHSPTAGHRHGLVIPAESGTTRHLPSGEATVAQATAGQLHARGCCGIGHRRRSTRDVVYGWSVHGSPSQSFGCRTSHRPCRSGSVVVTRIPSRGEERPRSVDRCAPDRPADYPSRASRRDRRRLRRRCVRSLVGSARSPTGADEAPLPQR
jgi:hypothetical protein